MNAHLDDVCINTLRFLAVDMVQKANSGHPGMPMGAAPMAYTLWDRFLCFDPADPAWPDRDRFVLSGGHGCAMLYSLLHLTGYDLPMEELQRFRQWGSRTPGHPEYGLTPGVEATTGPLGQGISNAVGMAIAEEALAARFNRPGHTVVDHYTYTICTDGDLMEGVASEAASLAGHLKLGKLIALYDDNRISIEGSTDLAFSEDSVARFAAYGWHVKHIDDGTDVAAVEMAIEEARAEAGRPSLIAVRTHIGYGSPNKQGKASAHGEPLGTDEVRLAKEALGWPLEPAFHVPEEALAHFGKALERGAAWHEEWRASFEAYRAEYPDLAAEFERRIAGELPEGWADVLPAFSADDGAMATREAGGKVMNAIAERLPELMGGSADLAPSTKTLLDGYADFSAEDRTGRNLRFGVREHGMGSVAERHGVPRRLRALRLDLPDLQRLHASPDPACRPQPPARRPRLHSRQRGPRRGRADTPAGGAAARVARDPELARGTARDPNETVTAWRIALEHRDRPVMLALSRQKLPTLDPAEYPQLAEGVMRGGYVLADSDGAPDVVLVASGSEVHLALEAREALVSGGCRCASGQHAVHRPVRHAGRRVPGLRVTRRCPRGLHRGRSDARVEGLSRRRSRVRRHRPVRGVSAR
jgi:transketolase